MRAESETAQDGAIGTVSARGSGRQPPGVVALIGREPVPGEIGALVMRGMDQFTFAERATDWRGNNNIAESIFAQMALEQHPIPQWIVCGAGTGGTSATIGRYGRYRRLATRICVADPEGSVFHRHWADRDVAKLDRCASRIEGIGRAHAPRVPWRSRHRRFRRWSR